MKKRKDKGKKHYDKKLRYKAVKMVLVDGKSIPEVSQEFNIHPHTLYCWTREKKLQPEVIIKKKENTCGNVAGYEAKTHTIPDSDKNTLIGVDPKEKEENMEMNEKILKKEEIKELLGAKAVEMKSGLDPNKVFQGLEEVKQQEFIKRIQELEMALEDNRMKRRLDELEKENARQKEHIETLKKAFSILSR